MKRKPFFKFMSILLVFVMCISLLPVTALAETTAYKFNITSNISLSGTDGVGAEMYYEAYNPENDPAEVSELNGSYIDTDYVYRIKILNYEEVIASHPLKAVSINDVTVRIPELSDDGAEPQIADMGANAYIWMGASDVLTIYMEALDPSADININFTFGTPSTTDYQFNVTSNLPLTGDGGVGANMYYAYSTGSTTTEVSDFNNVFIDSSYSYKVNMLNYGSVLENYTLKSVKVNDTSILLEDIEPGSTVWADIDGAGDNAKFSLRIQTTYDEEADTDVITGLLLNLVNIEPTADVTISYIFDTGESEGHLATAQSEDLSKGTVSASFVENTGDGSSKWVLTATPSTGYSFSNWTYSVEPSTEVNYITQATATVTISQDTTYTAHFAETQVSLGDSVLGGLHNSNIVYPYMPYSSDGKIIPNTPDAVQQSDVFIGEQVSFGFKYTLSGTVASGVQISFKLYEGNNVSGDPIAEATGPIDSGGSSGVVLPGTYDLYLKIPKMPNVSQLTVVVKLGDTADVTRTYDVTVNTPQSSDYITCSIAVADCLDPTTVTVLKGSSAFEVLTAALDKSYPSGNSYGTWYIDMQKGFINAIGIDPSESWSGFVNIPSSKGIYWGGGTYTVNKFFCDVGTAVWLSSDGESIAWFNTTREFTSLGTTYDHRITTLSFNGLSNPQLIWAIAVLRDYYTDAELTANCVSTSSTVDELKALYPGHASEMTWYLADSIASILNPIVDKIDAIGTVTSTSGDAIDAARDAYDGMPTTSFGSSGYFPYLFKTYEPYATAYNTLLADEAAYKELTGETTEAADPVTALTMVLNYIQANVTNPTPGSSGGEWAVLALARGGAVDLSSTWAKTYLSNLNSAIAAGDLTSLTDYERITLALSSLGIDASSYGTSNVNLTATFAAYNSTLSDLTINATIFALLALDSKPYTTDTTDFINAIINAALSGGGWTLSGSSADPDMTAMAIQALAPFYSSNSDVKTAVDKGLTALKSLQDTSTGGFVGSSGSLSTSSCAQVVTALCALGIDPTSADWTTTGGNPLTAMLTYYNTASGYFGDTSASANEMATEQAAYALVAYDRFKNGENALYDMSDAFVATDDASVKSVSVDGTAATAGTGNTFAVVLPYGTDMTALTTSDFVINPTGYYSSVTTAPSTSDSGATWTFTVTAQDGSTAVQYTVSVSVSTDPASASAADVAAVKADIGALTYSFPMATANTSNGIQALIEAKINALELNNVTTTVAMNSFTAAVAGTSANTSGTAGSFSFTITLSKGQGDTYASDSVTLAGTVTATAYKDTTSDTITVTFSLLGTSVTGGSGTVHTLKAGNLTTWIAATSVTISKGSTVGDVFAEVLDENGYTYTGLSGNYIKSITTPGGVTLAEFTNGTLSGWMYTVNGTHPGIGLNDYTLSSGDVIVWHYTDDYTKEEGSEKWSDSGSTSTTESQTLTPTTTVSGDTASANVSLTDIKDAIVSAKTSGTPIIIAPTGAGSAGKVNVTLASGAISAIAGQTSSDLTVQTNVGNITIPNSALDSIVTQSSGSTVTVSLGTVDTTSLTAAQQAAVGSDTVYDISILSGSSKITSFDGNSISVSLPYTLKDGESASGVTVWYLNDAGELEQITATYDKTTGLATFTTTHLSYYLVGYSATWTNPFTDIAESDWFYDAVKYAAQSELMSGTTPTTFEPNANMTRAMLVTVLYRLDGAPTVTGTNAFTDVKDGEWYTDAAVWASANGIVGGYGGGLFGTNDAITREQLATILMNYAKYKGYDVTKTADLTAYTDASGISSWAAAGMTWAAAEGLVTGTTTTALSPTGTATRAQVATILMRFFQLSVVPPALMRAASPAVPMVCIAVRQPATP
jgi:hypothetical protein